MLYQHFDPWIVSPILSHFVLIVVLSSSSTTIPMLRVLNEITSFKESCDDFSHHLFHYFNAMACQRDWSVVNGIIRVLPLSYWCHPRLFQDVRDFTILHWWLDDVSHCINCEFSHILVHMDRKSILTHSWIVIEFSNSFLHSSCQYEYY